MIRFALSAIALVGALETARMAPADHVAAMAAGATHVTAAAQPASVEEAASPAATAPANATNGKVFAPSGFGWG